MGKYKLLVVDDEIKLAKQIAIYFRNREWSVKEVYNGKDSIKMMESEKFDAVILDIQMPVMDGFEVLKKINKKQYDFCVVVLTGYAIKIENAVRAMKLGAWDYVTKPDFELDKLEVTLKNGIKYRNLKKGYIKALQMVARGVAHQVKNSLWVIKGNTKILSRILKDKKIKVEEIEEIGIIENEVDIVAQTVEELLNYSCEDIPHLESNIDLHQILNEVIENKKFSVRKKVEFHNQYTDFLPNIDGDNFQLKQIFDNVLQNAIEAMEEKIKQTKNFKKGIVKITTSIFNGNIEIRIEDNGIGIPEIDYEDGKIFIPFFSTKKYEAGEGMGLAICKTFVQMFGGLISVDKSIVGEGTTFLIELPIK